MDEDIISNPYREDMIANDKLNDQIKNKLKSIEINNSKNNNNPFTSKIFGKNSGDNTLSNMNENNLNQNNMAPSIPFNSKVKENMAQNLMSDEDRKLNSYRSDDNEEYAQKSSDSLNPINAFGRQFDNESDATIENNSRVGYVNKNNYVKDEDEEDDNSSVIQNPFRDDIDN